MPVDPIIARGIPPLGTGLGAAWTDIEQMRNRRALVEQDAKKNDLWARQQQMQMDRLAAADQDEAAWVEAIKAGDLDTAFALDRESTIAYAAYQKAQQPPAPIEEQRLPSGRYLATQGGDPVGNPWAPPQAQQYAPRQPTEFELYQRDPAAYEAFKKAGRAKPQAGEAPGAPGLGLNERQQGGMNMKRDAAISYAANLAGMTREEMEAVYASEGAAGVERRMLEKGKRSVQGKKARWLQSFPLGKTFVEAENADLLPQGKAGGAGIALVQNPAGMITKADFEAGEAQFPSPAYPLENQAEMVRSILTDAERAGGKSAAATDPLAQYAGQVIKQGNKRFQVIQGADGKYFAQELK